MDLTGSRVDFSAAPNDASTSISAELRDAEVRRTELAQASLKNLIRLGWKFPKFLKSEWIPSWNPFGVQNTSSNSLSGWTGVLPMYL